MSLTIDSYAYFVYPQTDISGSHGVLSGVFTADLHYIVIQVYSVVMHVHGYFTIWLCIKLYSGAWITFTGAIKIRHV